MLNVHGRAWLLAVACLAMLAFTHARNDGDVHSFGSNAFHQLGRTTDEGASNDPGIVELAEAATRIAAGSRHSLALTAKRGLVWSWGDNSHAQLAREGNDETIPGLVDGITVRVVNVAAGRLHSIAIAETGEVYTWGDNTHGQLGRPGDATKPARLYKMENVTIVKAAAGAQHTLLLSDVGEVYSVGSNRHNALGRGGVPHVAKRVEGVANVTQICAGEHHSAALTASGEVFTWGSNADGQLGHSYTPGVPGQVGGIATEKTFVIACGRAHTLAWTEHDLNAWGDNAAGQLGIDDAAHNVTFTTPVDDMANHFVTAMAAGDLFTLAVASKEAGKVGPVWSWGSNVDGELGREDAATKIDNVDFDATQRILRVAAGAEHSLALEGSVCPLECSEHGDCASGVCTCHYGWTGVGCQNEVQYKRYRTLRGLSTIGYIFLVCFLFLSLGTFVFYLRKYQDHLDDEEDAEDNAGGYVPSAAFNSSAPYGAPNDEFANTGSSPQLASSYGAPGPAPGQFGSSPNAAQFGSGMPPPGSMPPGSMPPGSMPPGSMPPGSMAPGPYGSPNAAQFGSGMMPGPAPGQFGSSPNAAQFGSGMPPPGSMPPGSMPPGSMPPGSMPPGSMPPGPPGGAPFGQQYGSQYGQFGSQPGGGF